jgi:hypothetical protein
MKEFNPERHQIETASALGIVSNAGAGDIYAAYVGLDVHKETIAVAVAEPGEASRYTEGRLPTGPRAWRNC